MGGGTMQWVGLEILWRVHGIFLVGVPVLPGVGWAGKVGNGVRNGVKHPIAAQCSGVLRDNIHVWWHKAVDGLGNTAEGAGNFFMAWQWSAVVEQGKSEIEWKMAENTPLQHSAVVVLGEKYSCLLAWCSGWAWEHCGGSRNIFCWRGY